MYPHCMTCHYNEFPLELNQLERIKRLIEPKVDVNLVVRPHQYYWLSSNKCNYGTSCHKTNNYSHKFNRITDELNLLFTAYIEQTDCDGYKEILYYLMGYFPYVYTEFEREVYIANKHREEN